MNVLLAITIISVSIYSVNCACDTNAVVNCTTAYAEGIKGNTNDLAKVCLISREYLGCVRGTGCAEFASVKATFDNVEKVLDEKCGASQVQISLLCLAFAFLTMFYK